MCDPANFILYADDTSLLNMNPDVSTWMDEIEKKTCHGKVLVQSID